MPTGIIHPDQFSQSHVTSSEYARALKLTHGKIQPATGFERHLLKCWKNQANPACPKEEALLSKCLLLMFSVELEESDELQPSNPDEDASIGAELMDDAFGYAKSDEDGWFYDD
jgi:hypothetical protein